MEGHLEKDFHTPFAAVESIGIAPSDSMNPLEQYLANYARIMEFYFKGMIESATFEEDQDTIEYSMEDLSDNYTKWCVMPCYDLTNEYWRHGEFELNGEPPLRFMTSEVVDKMPLAGTYATIGTAYLDVLRIRLYDCDAGVYTEFRWHEDTSARHAVSSSHLSSYPSYVYYPVQ